MITVTSPRLPIPGLEDGALLLAPSSATDLHNSLRQVILLPKCFCFLLHVFSDSLRLGLSLIMCMHNIVYSEILISDQASVHCCSISNNSNSTL